jgi:hypothetical protein
VPLTADGIDKTEYSDLLNQSIQFFYFKQELPTPYLIGVHTEPKDPMDVTKI